MSTGQHRMRKFRALTAAGFRFVAGWVREEDVPAIQSRIDAAKEDAARAEGDKT